MEIPKQEKETESIFKTIIVDNISNLGKENDLQIREAQKLQVG